MISIAAFIQYLETEKRYSTHTVTAYSVDLSQFAEFLKKQYEMSDLLQADHRQIRTWLAELMNDGQSERSVHRKLSSLKSFYKYHCKQGVISINPANKAVTPKLKKRLPTFVEEKQMDDMLRSLSAADDFETARDFAILELFYASGIRLSELITLEESKLDLQNRSIKVFGKRKKERIIPLSSAACEALQLYIDQKKILTNRTKSHPYLFIRENGEMMYSGLVYRIVKKYLSQFTTLEKRSPHVLRHTFATHILNHGANLNAVKDLLGHSSLAATQVYTHNTVEKLKKTYQEAHPRA